MWRQRRLTMTPSQLLHRGSAVLRERWTLRRATRLGAGVRLWNRLSLRGDGALLVDDGVCFLPGATPVGLTVTGGGTLAIGARSFISPGVCIAARQLVRIGAWCLIGPDVLITDNDEYTVDPERRDDLPPSAPVILEASVWLGARVIVLPGVTIGTGSVVAAKSVVTRAIPSNCLAAGCPARVIRTLE